jgi:chaperone modulatory protein CbpM
MASFDDILATYRIERIELTTWIRQQWVRPAETPQGYLFDEVDEARVALIRDLRQDMMVDDEALELILSLIDQLYATRRVLHSVEEALDALPDPVRAEIRSRIGVTKR